MEMETNSLARNKIWIPILISILFAITSFELHQFEGTTLIQDHDVWQSRMNFSAEYPPFVPRVFTRAPVNFLHSFFGLEFRTAFALLQYFLFMLLGMTSFHFFRTLGFSFRWSILGQVFVLSSYPVLCAFFVPVYTWDDFWQYVLSVAAFWALFREKPISGAIALTLGILARETTFFLWPVWAYGVSMVGTGTPRRKAAAVLLPLGVFLLFWFLVHTAPEEARWHVFAKNFLNSARSQDVVYSVLVSFGFLWATYALALVLRVRNQLSDREGVIWHGAAYAVIVYTVTGLVFGLARETRLFFPPFLFVIPVSLWLLQHIAPMLRRYYSAVYGLAGILTVTLTIWAGITIANLAFPSFDFRGWPDFARTYLGVHIGLTLAVFTPLMVTGASNAVKRLLTNSAAG